jgi:hypothetical protein
MTSVTRTPSSAKTSSPDQGGADPLRREGPKSPHRNRGVPTHSVGRAPNGIVPGPPCAQLAAVDALDGDGQLVSLRERLKGGPARNNSLVTLVDASLTTKFPHFRPLIRRSVEILPQNCARPSPPWGGGRHLALDVHKGQRLPWVDHHRIRARRARASEVAPREALDRRRRTGPLAALIPSVLFGM